MKYNFTLSLILVLVSMSTYLTGQEVASTWPDSKQGNEWAAIGSKWYYHYAYFMSNGFTAIESVGDTLIGSKTCRKLVKTRYRYEDLLDSVFAELLGVEYTCQEGEKVNIYRKGIFYTLYDFSAQIGDTWIVPYSWETECDTTGIVKVVGKGNELIDGISYGYIEVVAENDQGWGWGFSPSYGERIYERIGCMSYLLPYANCMFDMGYEGGPIRCFYSPEVGLLHFDGNTDCEKIYTSLAENRLSSVMFRLSPNPAASNVKITLNDTDNYRVRIFTINGLLVKSLEFFGHETTLDVSLLPRGCYQLQVQNNKSCYTNKLLKY